MKSDSLSLSRLLVGFALAIFALAGCLLFVPTLCSRAFDANQVVWDLQWLNAWSIGFVIMLLVVWHSRFELKTRTLLTLGCFSLWGLVGVGLLFDGTPFSLNSYWGDQQFRTAMILKFKTFAWPTDMYLKDLPPFYPPAYYYLLSIVARVFSLEAYQMLKVGSLLIFFLGPPLLYLFWTRLVSHLQALCIVIVTFLVQTMAVFTAPHEFLANAFFVPWWLLFIEQVHTPRQDKRWFMTGGLIGGGIFMCYYYAFFVGGLVLLARSLSAFRKSRDRMAKLHRLKNSWIALGWAGLCSAPYWLPLLVSILTIGFSSGQNRWFSIGYANMDFPMFEFSYVGVLMLGGLLYTIFRVKARLYKALLALTAAVPVYYLIGSVLGNLDTPVLYIKARDFLWPVLSALIGLAFAGIFRLKRKGRLVNVLGLGAAVFVLICVSSFSQLLNLPETRDIRKAAPERRFTDMAKQPNKVGAVFLTNIYQFPVFVPAYMFVSPSEHIAHPAGRFFDRTCLLGMLQTVSDPYLFSVALRNNEYDRIDYLMPKLGKDRFEISYTLSNYPDRLIGKTVSYDLKMLKDTLRFTREGPLDVFRVNEVPPSAGEHLVLKDVSIRDSLLTVAKYHLLRHHLNAVGKGLLDVYTGADWSSWHSLLPEGEADKVAKLQRVEAVSVNDSIYLALQFRVLSDFSDDFRVFLHVYAGADGKGFANHDFAPQPPTSTWKKGDIVVCQQVIPDPASDFRFHVGLFLKERRLGDGFIGEFQR